MNIDELLARWREDELGDVELKDLTRSLDQPGNRQRLAHDWMVDFALPEALSAAALQSAPQPPPVVKSPRVVRWITHHPAALAACAAVLVGAGVWLSLLSPRHTQDVNAAFASVQDSISRASVQPPSSMSDWMSPTASLLEPASLPR